MLRVDSELAGVCRARRRLEFSEPSAGKEYDEANMDTPDIEKLIHQQSGLLGVSGISSDMRTLLASVAPDAKAAVDLYVYRISRELESLMVGFEGLEAIVFTAGIGENSEVLGKRVCKDATCLGVEFDG